MPAAEPHRSCLGCRSVKGKKDLLRFVLDPERRLAPDLLDKLPGRGAYTCLSVACIRSAVTKRGFPRAFRGEVITGDVEALLQQLKMMMEERIASYLSLANKGGKIVSGTDMVRELFKKRTPGLLFVASDISGESGDKACRLAEGAGVESVSIFGKERLGALIGKEMRTLVAVEESGFSKALKKEIFRYNSFFQGGCS